MVVFKYVNKNTGELIGYHASTFCQTTTLEKAKRYKCTEENVEKQKATIYNNFKAVMNATEENQKGKIFNLLPIKETFFKDLTLDDVELQYEFVPDVDVSFHIHAIIN
jgi:hypothetical protein